MRTSHSTATKSPSTPARSKKADSSVSAQSVKSRIKAWAPFCPVSTRWCGTLNAANIEGVAARIRLLLTGKPFYLVTSITNNLPDFWLLTLKPRCQLTTGVTVRRSLQTPPYLHWCINDYDWLFQSSAGSITDYTYQFPFFRFSCEGFCIIQHEPDLTKRYAYQLE